MEEIRARLDRGSVNIHWHEALYIYIIQLVTNATRRMILHLIGPFPGLPIARPHTRGVNHEEYESHLPKIYKKLTNRAINMPALQLTANWWHSTASTLNYGE